MYVLYSSPDTASLIVRLVLTELDLPHECKVLDRAAGDMDTPQYRAMQPLGLLPALETPDGAMFETAAMLLHLADRHGGLAPAPLHPDRAAFLGWFMFTNSSVHTTLLQLFYPDRVGGPECAAAVVLAARARMQTYLALLDAMVARDAPGWLSAGRPSVLGYYLGVLIRWLATHGPDHPSYFRSADFPALHAVLAALETRPAAIACAEAEALGPTLFTNPAY